MNEELDRLTETIIGAAIEVHKVLGPGLLESAYEACLVYELIERGLRVEKQVELPVKYKGVVLDCGYRIDVLVDELVILELKSVDKVEPIHEAQLLSYLKLAGKHVGLLINFNVTQLTKGIRRRVNELPE
jgi:GxxExxY protein